MPRFLRHTLRSRIHNFGLFWGPQKQEKQKNYHSSTLEAKNKLRGNFILEKVMDILFFYKVFQTSFFPILTCFKLSMIMDYCGWDQLFWNPCSIFQVFKSMLGRVIVSGFWILDKKKTHQKNFLSNWCGNLMSNLNFSSELCVPVKKVGFITLILSQF